jgi:osmotically-inducible protein OsmY
MRRSWTGLSAATVGLIFGVGLGGASPRALADDEGSKDADDKQEQQIERALQKAPDLKDNHIDVDVDDGIATLEGTVDSQREKKEATKLSHVDGILGTNNRLKVRASGK